MRHGFDNAMQVVSKAFGKIRTLHDYAKTLCKDSATAASFVQLYNSLDHDIQDYHCMFLLVHEADTVCAQAGFALQGIETR